MTGVQTCALPIYQQRRHPARQVVQGDDGRRVGPDLRRPRQGSLHLLQGRVADHAQAKVRSHHQRAFTSMRCRCTAQVLIVLSLADRLGCWHLRQLWYVLVVTGSMAITYAIHLQARRTTALPSSRSSDSAERSLARESRCALTLFSSLRCPTDTCLNSTTSTRTRSRPSRHHR